MGDSIIVAVGGGAGGAISGRAVGRFGGAGSGRAAEDFGGSGSDASTVGFCAGVAFDDGAVARASGAGVCRGADCIFTPRVVAGLNVGAVFCGGGINASITRCRHRLMPAAVMRRWCPIFWADAGLTPPFTGTAVAMSWKAGAALAMGGPKPDDAADSARPQA